MIIICQNKQFDTDQVYRISGSHHNPAIAKQLCQVIALHDSEHVKVCMLEGTETGKFFLVKPNRIVKE